MMRDGQAFGAGAKLIVFVMLSAAVFIGSVNSAFQASRVSHP
jgi:hypothetical protein